MTNKKLDSKLIQEDSSFWLKETFTAYIAHELSNPLVGILNALRVLEGSRATKDCESRRLIKMAEYEAQHCIQTLAVFLDLTKGHQLVKQERNLKSMVDAPIQSAHLTPDIQIQYFSEPDPFFVWVQPTLFQHVLINLFVNAAQAMESRGKVFITALRLLEMDLIEFHDNGPGIPPEYREKVFEPTFSDRPDGTGLGLMICRHIIDSHEGRIYIRDCEMGGATFSIGLPRYKHKQTMNIN